MNIRPSANIRQNYNEIQSVSFEQGTRTSPNGEGDLVVMDIEAFTRRERCWLCEELLSVEEDSSRKTGCGVDELDSF